MRKKQIQKFFWLSLYTVTLLSLGGGGVIQEMSLAIV